ncbi:MAG TPA: type II toxin-antitoxin system Phd/YefM family antitoxin [Methylophilaceae bacterium]|nr:type II toxin-antitoxin system Phd/YefM family antitoxin [Methylophilaceae bacterium]
MNTLWQLQEAKNRFSEVVDEALIHGPQTVTRHGREVVVILAMEEYRRMKQPKNTLVEFLQVSPLAAVELDITRSKELPREIDL